MADSDITLTALTDCDESASKETALDQKAKFKKSTGKLEAPPTTAKTNGLSNLSTEKPKADETIHSAGGNASKWEERLRVTREKQMEDLRRKADGLKESEMKAEECRKKADDERKKKMEEMKKKEEHHRIVVEERKKKMMEDENERRLILMKKTMDRDLKLDQQQKHKTNGDAKLLNGTKSPKQPHHQPHQASPQQQQQQQQVKRPHSVAGRPPSYASPTVASTTRMARSSEKDGEAVTVCYRCRSAPPDFRSKLHEQQQQHQQQSNGQNRSSHPVFGVTVPGVEFFTRASLNFQNGKDLKQVNGKPAIIIRPLEALASKPPLPTISATSKSMPQNPKVKKKRPMSAVLEPAKEGSIMAMLEARNLKNIQMENKSTASPPGSIDSKKRPKNQFTLSLDLKTHGTDHHDLSTDEVKPKKKDAPQMKKRSTSAVPDRKKADQDTGKSVFVAESSSGLATTTSFPTAKTSAVAAKQQTKTQKDMNNRLESKGRKLPPSPSVEAKRKSEHDKPQKIITDQFKDRMTSLTKPNFLAPKTKQPAPVAPAFEIKKPIPKPAKSIDRKIEERDAKVSKDITTPATETLRDGHITEIKKVTDKTKDKKPKELHKKTLGSSDVTAEHKSKESEKKPKHVERKPVVAEDKISRKEKLVPENVIIEKKEEEIKKKKVETPVDRTEKRVEENVSQLVEKKETEEDKKNVEKADLAVQSQADQQQDDGKQEDIVEQQDEEVDIKAEEARLKAEIEKKEEAEQREKERLEKLKKDEEERMDRKKSSSIEKDQPLSKSTGDDERAKTESVEEKPLEGIPKEEKVDKFSEKADEPIERTENEKSIEKMESEKHVGEARIGESNEVEVEHSHDEGRVEKSIEKTELEKPSMKVEVEKPKEKLETIEPNEKEEIEKPIESVEKEKSEKIETESTGKKADVDGISEETCEGKTNEKEEAEVTAPPKDSETESSEHHLEESTLDMEEEEELVEGTEGSKFRKSSFFDMLTTKLKKALSPSEKKGFPKTEQAHQQNIQDISTLMFQAAVEKQKMESETGTTTEETTPSGPSSEPVHERRESSFGFFGRISSRKQSKDVTAEDGVTSKESSPPQNGSQEKRKSITDTALNVFGMMSSRQKHQSKDLETTQEEKAAVAEETVKKENGDSKEEKKKLPESDSSSMDIEMSTFNKHSTDLISQNESGAVEERVSTIISEYVPSFGDNTMGEVEQEQIGNIHDSEIKKQIEDAKQFKTTDENLTSAVAMSSDKKIKEREQVDGMDDVCRSKPTSQRPSLIEGVIMNPLQLAEHSPALTVRLEKVDTKTEEKPPNKVGDTKPKLISSETKDKDEVDKTGISSDAIESKSQLDAVGKSEEVISENSNIIQGASSVEAPKFEIKAPEMINVTSPDMINIVVQKKENDHHRANLSNLDSNLSGSTSSLDFVKSEDSSSGDILMSDESPIEVKGQKGEKMHHGDGETEEKEAGVFDHSLEKTSLKDENTASKQPPSDKLDSLPVLEVHPTTSSSKYDDNDMTQDLVLINGYHDDRDDLDGGLVSGPMDSKEAKIVERSSDLKVSKEMTTAVPSSAEQRPVTLGKVSEVLNKNSTLPQQSAPGRCMTLELKSITVERPLPLCTGPAIPATITTEVVPTTATTTSVGISETATISSVSLVTTATSKSIEQHAAKPGSMECSVTGAHCHLQEDSLTDIIETCQSKAADESDKNNQKTPPTAVIESRLLDSQSFSHFRSFPPEQDANLVEQDKEVDNLSEIDCESSLEEKVLIASHVIRKAVDTANTVAAESDEGNIIMKSSHEMTHKNILDLNKVPQSIEKKADSRFVSETPAVKSMESKDGENKKTEKDSFSTDFELEKTNEQESLQENSVEEEDSLELEPTASLSGLNVVDFNNSFAKMSLDSVTITAFDENTLEKQEENKSGMIQKMNIIESKKNSFGNLSSDPNEDWLIFEEIDQRVDKLTELDVKEQILCDDQIFQNKLECPHESYGAAVKKIPDIHQKNESTKNDLFSEVGNENELLHHAQPHDTFIDSCHISITRKPQCKLSSENKHMTGAVQEIDMEFYGLAQAVSSATVTTVTATELTTVKSVVPTLTSNEDFSLGETSSLAIDGKEKVKLEVDWTEQVTLPNMNMENISEIDNQHAISKDPTFDDYVVLSRTLENQPNSIFLADRESLSSDGTTDAFKIENEKNTKIDETKKYDAKERIAVHKIDKAIDEKIVENKKDDAKAENIMEKIIDQKDDTKDEKAVVHKEDVTKDEKIIHKKDDAKDEKVVEKTDNAKNEKAVENKKDGHKDEKIAENKKDDPKEEKVHKKNDAKDDTVVQNKTDIVKVEKVAENKKDDAKDEKIIEDTKNEKVVVQKKDDATNKKIVENKKDDAKDDKVVVHKADDAKVEKIVENKKDDSKDEKVAEKTDDAKDEKIFENKKSDPKDEKVIEKTDDVKYDSKDEKIYENKKDDSKDEKVHKKDGAKDDMVVANKTGDAKVEKIFENKKDDTKDEKIIVHTVDVKDEKEVLNKLDDVKDEKVNVHKKDDAKDGKVNVHKKDDAKDGKVSVHKKDDAKDDKLVVNETDDAKDKKGVENKKDDPKDEKMHSKDYLKDEKVHRKDDPKDEKVHKKDDAKNEMIIANKTDDAKAVKIVENKKDDTKDERIVVHMMDVKDEKAALTKMDDVKDGKINVHKKDDAKDDEVVVHKKDDPKDDKTVVNETDDAKDEKIVENKKDGNKDEKVLVHKKVDAKDEKVVLNITDDVKDGKVDVHKKDGAKDEKVFVHKKDDLKEEEVAVKETDDAKDKKIVESQKDEAKNDRVFKNEKDCDNDEKVIVNKIKNEAKVEEKKNDDNVEKIIENKINDTKYEKMERKEDARDENIGEGKEDDAKDPMNTSVKNEKLVAKEETDDAVSTILKTQQTDSKNNANGKIEENKKSGVSDNIFEKKILVVEDVEHFVQDRTVEDKNKVRQSIERVDDESEKIFENIKSDAKVLKDDTKEQDQEHDAQEKCSEDKTDIDKKKADNKINQKQQLTDTPKLIGSSTFLSQKGLNIAKTEEDSVVFAPILAETKIVSESAELIDFNQITSSSCDSSDADFTQQTKETSKKAPTSDEKQKDLIEEIVHSPQTLSILIENKLLKTDGANQTNNSNATTKLDLDIGSENSKDVGTWHELKNVTPTESVHEKPILSSARDDIEETISLSAKHQSSEDKKEILDQIKADHLQDLSSPVIIHSKTEEMKTSPTQEIGNANLAIDQTFIEKKEVILNSDASNLKETSTTSVAAEVGVTTGKHVEKENSDFKENSSVVKYVEEAHLDPDIKEMNVNAAHVAGTDEIHKNGRTEKHLEEMSTCVSDLKKPTLLISGKVDAFPAVISKSGGIEAAVQQVLHEPLEQVIEFQTDSPENILPHEKELSIARGTIKPASQSSKLHSASHTDLKLLDDSIIVIDETIMQPVMDNQREESEKRVTVIEDCAITEGLSDVKFEIEKQMKSQNTVGKEVEMSSDNETKSSEPESKNEERFIEKLTEKIVKIVSSEVENELSFQKSETYEDIHEFKQAGHLVTKLSEESKQFVDLNSLSSKNKSEPESSIDVTIKKMSQILVKDKEAMDVYIKETYNHSESVQKEEKEVITKNLEDAPQTQDNKREKIETDVDDLKPLDEACIKDEKEEIKVINEKLPVFSETVKNKSDDLLPESSADNSWPIRIHGDHAKDNSKLVESLTEKNLEACEATNLLVEDSEKLSKDEAFSDTKLIYFDEDSKLDSLSNDKHTKDECTENHKEVAESILVPSSPVSILSQKASVSFSEVQNSAVEKIKCEASKPPFQIMEHVDDKLAEDDGLVLFKGSKIEKEIDADFEEKIEPIEKELMIESSAVQMQTIQNQGNQLTIHLPHSATSEHTTVAHNIDYKDSSKIQLHLLEDPKATPTAKEITRVEKGDSEGTEKQIDEKEVNKKKLVEEDLIDFGTHVDAKQIEEHTTVDQTRVSVVTSTKVKSEGKLSTTELFDLSSSETKNRSSLQTQNQETIKEVKPEDVNSNVGKPKQGHSHCGDNVNQTNSSLDMSKPFNDDQVQLTDRKIYKTQDNSIKTSEVQHKLCSQPCSFKEEEEETAPLLDGIEYESITSITPSVDRTSIVIKMTRPSSSSSEPSEKILLGPDNSSCFEEVKKIEESHSSMVGEEISHKKVNLNCGKGHHGAVKIVSDPCHVESDLMGTSGSSTSSYSTLDEHEAVGDGVKTTLSDELHQSVPIEQVNASSSSVVDSSEVTAARVAAAVPITTATFSATTAISSSLKTSKSEKTATSESPTDNESHDVSTLPSSSSSSSSVTSLSSGTSSTVKEAHIVHLSNAKPATESVIRTRTASSKMIPGELASHHKDYCPESYETETVDVRDEIVSNEKLAKRGLRDHQGSDDDTNVVSSAFDVDTDLKPSIDNKKETVFRKCTNQMNFNEILTHDTEVLKITENETKKSTCTISTLKSSDSCDTDNQELLCVSIKSKDGITKDEDPNQCTAHSLGGTSAYSVKTSNVQTTFTKFDTTLTVMEKTCQEAENGTGTSGVIVERPQLSDDDNTSEWHGYFPSTDRVTMLTLDCDKKCRASLDLREIFKKDLDAVTGGGDQSGKSSIFL